MAASARADRRYGFDSYPAESSVLEYFDRYSNWGRWSDADERGTLNFITTEAGERGTTRHRRRSRWQFLLTIAPLRIELGCSFRLFGLFKRFILGFRRRLVGASL